jgi:hypothetical protein
MVQELNPGWGEIVCHPDLSQVPPSLLYNGYQVFPGGEAVGAIPLPPLCACPGMLWGEIYPDAYVAYCCIINV